MKDKTNKPPLAKFVSKDTPPATAPAVTTIAPKKSSYFPSKKDKKH